jgi:thiamine kinase-like enzyme
MAKSRGNRYGLSKSPEEILTILEKIAADYDLRSPKQRLFYFWDWAILRQINWGSLSSIKKYLGTLRRGLQPTTYRSFCGADYVLLKNHYLGFYLKQKSIIKVFLEEDSFNRHIQGMQRFGEFKNIHLKVPKILGFGLTLCPHTLESYIPGGNFQQINLDLGIELIEELANFHFDQPREMEEFMQEDEKQLILESLKKLDLDPLQLDKIRTFLKPTSWKVVEGEIHGDINRGNLIRGKEAVYLTDWEFFSRGPIAQDMVKLYNQAEDRVRQIILNVYQNKLDSLKQRQPTSSFLSSLLLYSLKSLLHLYQESREQLLLVLKDPSEVNKKIANYEQIQLRSIQSLLKASEKQ